MPAYRFTDEQIQEYLDGIFTGDTAAMKTYLYQTEEGKQRLSEYTFLYEALLKEPLPEPVLSLEESVIAALESRQPAKRFRWLWIPAIGFGLAVLIYSFVTMLNFDFFGVLTGSRIIVGIMILSAILLIACHGIDSWDQQKRYRKALGV